MSPELFWFPNLIILYSKYVWNKPENKNSFPKNIFFYFHKNGGFFSTSFLQLGKKFRKPEHVMPMPKKKEIIKASRWAPGEMQGSWFILLNEIGNCSNIYSF